MDRYKIIKKGSAKPIKPKKTKKYRIVKNWHVKSRTADYIVEQKTWWWWTVKSSEYTGIYTFKTVEEAKKFIDMGCDPYKVEQEIIDYIEKTA